MIKIGITAEAYAAIEASMPLGGNVGVERQVRRNEASELVWSEIDFNHQRLVISGDRMKNGEPHELPLSAPTIALLKGRQPAGARPSGLVFPTASNRPHTNWSAVINRIRKAIGESETTKDLRFTLHDIRRGFVSHLAELFDVDALDQCLAHTRSGVRGVYQLSKRMDARAQALAAWAAILLDDAQPDPRSVEFARQSCAPRRFHSRAIRCASAI